MTIQERVTLLNAGYSKETIDAWEAGQEAAPTPAANVEPAEPTPQPVPVQVPAQQPAPAPASQAAQPAPAPAPVQQVATPQAVTQPQPVTLSPEQLTQLIQGVAVQTSSGTIETPPTAEDSLRKLFEGIVGTVNQKED